MIADSQGDKVANGQIGELLVKGPIVTPGYWQRPQATLAAFNADGWFRTGDAVYRDDDGFFFVVDRWKDMFISGGENVYPAEIENALGLLDEIFECAVIGVPDGKWGEVGCAFIVRRGETQIEPPEILGHCEAHLARYKVPKEIVFVDALPRNASGKILKSQLRNSRAQPV